MTDIFHYLVVSIVLMYSPDVLIEEYVIMME